MKLNYVKLSDTRLKFFFENDGAYGEFYLHLNKDGTAEISAKDPDYADVLSKAFSETMHELDTPENEKYPNGNKCPDCGGLVVELTFNHGKEAECKGCGLTWA